MSGIRCRTWKVGIVLLLGIAGSSCGRAERERLGAQVETLEERVRELEEYTDALEAALEEANSAITDAASEIENAQSAVFLDHDILVDAVQGISTPDEVVAPPRP